MCHVFHRAYVPYLTVKRRKVILGTTEYRVVYHDPRGIAYTHGMFANLKNAMDFMMKLMQTLHCEARYPRFAG